MAASRSGDLNQRPSPQTASQAAGSSMTPVRIPTGIPTMATSTPTAVVTPMRRRRRRSKPAQSAEPTTESVLEGSEAVVHSFAQRHPLWLTALLKVQQGSFLLTFSLIVAAMVVYGWTVYIQQRWGQEYEKLEALKKQERQLISANEVLKNQMAEQAESPTAGLLLPNPNNAIFLAPAPQRPPVKPSPSPSPSDSFKRPLGY